MVRDGDAPATRHPTAWRPALVGTGDRHRQDGHPERGGETEGTQVEMAERAVLAAAALGKNHNRRAVLDQAPSGLAHGTRVPRVEVDRKGAQHADRAAEDGDLE